jgi:hypothetical protein
MTTRKTLRPDTSRGFASFWFQATITCPDRFAHGVAGNVSHPLPGYPRRFFYGNALSL